MMTEYSEYIQEVVKTKKVRLFLLFLMYRKSVGVAVAAAEKHSSFCFSSTQWK